MFRWIVACVVATAATEYVDLAYDLDESSLFWPGQRFDYELFKDVAGYNVTKGDHLRFWHAQFSFCMGEHGSTHVDAPFHFSDRGWKLGEIPLSRLMDVPAVLVDVEPLVFAMDDPGLFEVKPEHLLQHESVHGRIPDGSFVIIHTGWGRFWPDKNKFWGIDKNTGLFHFPTPSGAAAQWLATERNVYGLGIDTQSMDAGERPIVHMTLLPHNLYFIENMANLEGIRDLVSSGYAYTYANATASPPPATCDLRLIVLPIKSRGTGGPVRVLAYCKPSCQQH